MATGKTLKEQLASIRNRIFAKSAMVQPVSQVAFECESGDTQSAFLTAQKEVLKWVARRAGRQLPDKAWDGQTFDLADVGSQPTAAVAIEKPRYWAVRIDDADKEVARRTWTTEIGIGIAPNYNTLFGCRLFCAALGVALEEAALYFPRSRAAVAAPGLWLTGMLDAIKEVLTFSLRLSHIYELFQREHRFFCARRKL